MFTDIADSTRLKSPSGIGAAAYAKLAQRHDNLFRALVADVPGGEVVKDIGDGFMATFPTASEAVRTALRFQFALHSDPAFRVANAEGSPQPFQVRVGIHQGEVSVLDLDIYDREKLVGPAADMAARLQSLALPGQILISRAAFDEARHFIREHPALDGGGGHPPLAWRSHGRYRLKGIYEPQEIFEVGAGDIGPARTPPGSDKAKRVQALRRPIWAFLLLAIGISLPLVPLPKEPAGAQIASTIYRHWLQSHSGLGAIHETSPSIRYVTIWFQNFATGYIAYNVIDREAIIYLGKSRKYRRVDTPTTHLTPRNEHEINATLFTALLNEIEVEVRPTYRALVEERVQFNRVGIIGGIGTVYLREKLLDELGPPLVNETRIDHVLRAQGTGYEVLVGLPIGSESFAKGNRVSPRRVSVLHGSGYFDDYRELPDSYEGVPYVGRRLREFWDTRRLNYWYWPVVGISGLLVVVAVQMLIHLWLDSRRKGTLVERAALPMAFRGKRS